VIDSIEHVATVSPQLLLNDDYNFESSQKDESRKQARDSSNKLLPS